jgi:predicted transcriptional regulator
MSSEKIKEYLLQIAGSVNQETKLDDIYEQLALLNDIDESEEEVRQGKILSHQEVIARTNQWLK